MGNIKILDLDDIETANTDIHIIHKGEKHFMKVMDVDGFIKLEKRQRDAEKRAIAGEDDVQGVVELMKQSIGDFFPTLPVGELPVPKLFSIFAWMNEMREKMNDDSAAEVVEETQDEEGNVASPSQES